MAPTGPSRCSTRAGRSSTQSHPWDLGGSWILTAHAALALGDTVAASAACTNADRLLRPLGDDWILDHLDALLGYIAQAEERFDDAATHLRRAAIAAKRLGYASTEGSHLDTLGRVLEQAGQIDEAITTLERVIEIGRTTRQLRLLALGRVHLGRVLRAHGDRDAALLAVRAADHWFESSGGGDGAALASCLHAAMDAEDGDDSAEPRLRAVLERRPRPTHARHRDHGPRRASPAAQRTPTTSPQPVTCSTPPTN